MATQELKFRVESFDELMPKLQELGAVLFKDSESTHYYCPLAGNDVLKLVAKQGRFEIHELKYRDGKFELVRNERVDSLVDGLNLLASRGFDKVSLVHMSHADYQYEDGIIGLYKINKSLKSVILDFAPDKHEMVARLLGLEKAEPIAVPYNKYLEQRRELKSTEIAELINHAETSAS